MIMEHEFPILEYSTQKDAVINPKNSGDPFPRLCLVVFFQDVLDSFVKEYGGEIIGNYVSEMRRFPAYRLTYKETEICVVQAVVGSGSIAMMTDWLYGRGAEVVLCCGSCGVLAEIPAGDVIIPVRALRDEGASYKYLPPSRYVELDKRPIEVFRQVLKEKGIPYVECTTWSTDGFYRETKDMVVALGGGVDGPAEGGMYGCCTAGIFWWEMRSMTTGTGLGTYRQESGSFGSPWRPW